MSLKYTAGFKAQDPKLNRAFFVSCSVLCSVSRVEHTAMFPDPPAAEINS